MKTLLPLLAVALTAAPAYAQEGPSQQRLWPVQAAGQSCTISQSFADPDLGMHTLDISYDASRQSVSLTSTNAAPRELPESGELSWRIVFRDNGDEAYDDAWGTRTFSYVRDEEAYRFSTRFVGERNVRQILADLAASRSVGFMARDKLVTAFDLEGIDRSLDRLRACAARAIAAN